MGELPSLVTTRFLSALLDARKQGFGLRAYRRALLSAPSALYHRRPWFRFTSREIVEGDLFSRRAIDRMLFFADGPALISSRSSRVRCCGTRFLLSGLMPPCSRKIVKIDPGLASRIRAMPLNPVPRFHKSNTRSRSS